ncbi:MAG: tRNA dihydrouridine(20/20a) synthase DusA [Pseudomonadota bacterium]
MKASSPHRLSVAPMMDWTDRHCRYFLRLISRRALLYSEMIPAGAIVYGDRARYLAFDPAEQPLALQVGGADEDELARAAEAAAAAGYRELNLNVGCPSNRVQKARFGACLMAEPALVGQLVATMARASGLPVTVKCRIGIDQQDHYDDLKGFVETVAEAGCRSFAVHARKAWLKGLSPKQNRELPPLRYDRVYRLKADFPALEILVNGGIQSLDEALDHLGEVDGVMIGRAAYHNPYLLAEADRRIFGDGRPAPSRGEIVAGLLPYAAREVARGVPVKSITRHILGLFNGLPGARQWRRHLSEEAHRPGAGPAVIEAAYEKVAEVLERRGEAA